MYSFKPQVSQSYLWVWSQSVQSLSRVQLFVTPWTAARQASLSITNSRSLLKLMSIESVLPSNLILCRPLLFLPSTSPSIRVFSKESVLRIRWPKYRSFSFSISRSNEYSGLISFRIDLFDLLAVQGTLKSFLQHRSVGEVFYWRWKVTPKQTIGLGSCWPHSQLSKSLFIYCSNKREVGGRR